MKLNIQKISLLVLLLLFGFTRQLQAQTKETQTNNLISVTTNPEVESDNNITLNAEPGEIITAEFLVRNLSSTTQDIRTTKSKPESDLLSINEWINLEKEFQLFVLKPNDEIAVPFTIQVPINAEPGDRSANLIFTPIDFSDEAVLANIGSGIKTNISLKISGEQTRSFQIAEFSAPEFSEYGPININLKLRNSGNINTSINATITITNTFGTQIADWSIANEQILAGNENTYETEWVQKGTFGLYKAELELTSEIDNEVLNQTLFFWIIPWRTILVITSFSILLIIFCYYIYKVRNKLRKSKLKESNKLKLLNEDSK